MDSGDRLDLGSLIVAVSFSMAAMGPVWLIFGIKTWGTTTHTHKRITDAEQAELEGLFSRSTAGRPHPRPSGRPTYQRKMFSGYGAAVYPRGIHGHWQLGRKARLRFVPFEDLSAVYPVELTIRMWWKPKPYEGIQLETRTGLVLPVDSIRHDVPAFRLALERALGTGYARLYHGDEPISTSIFDGRAGAHATLRARWPPSPPVTPEVGGPWARPDTIDKGERLAFETREDVSARLRPYRRLSAVLLGPGALAMALPLVAAGRWTLWPALIGIAFAATAALLIHVTRNWHTPFELFERGVLAYPPSNYPPTFYAFSTVRGVEQKHGWMSGDFYLFRGSSQRMSMQLPRGAPFGDRAAEQARKVVGSGQADDIATRLRQLQAERSATSLFVPPTDEGSPAPSSPQPPT